MPLRVLACHQLRSASTRILLALALAPALRAAPPFSAPDPRVAAADRLGLAVESQDPATLLSTLTQDGHLSEDEAVLCGLARHPEIAALRAQRGAALGDFRTATLYPNPVLTLQGEEIEPGVRLGSAQVTVGIEQEILTAGKRHKRLQTANDRVESTDWLVVEGSVDLASRIRSAYRRILAGRELGDVTSEQVRLGRELLEIVEKRLAVGAATLTEALRAQAQVATLEVDQEQAKASELEARAALAAAMGDATLADLPTIGALPAPGLTPDFGTLWHRIEGHAPALRRLASQRAASASQVHEAEAEGHPNVTLGLGVRRNRDLDDTSYLATFGWPLPIRDRNQGNRERVRAELAGADASLAARALELEGQLRRLLVDLARLEHQCATYRTVILPKAREALSLSRTGYQTGKFPYLNVLDAQRELAEALRRDLDLRSEHAQQEVQLDAMLGYPIESSREESR